MKLPTEVKVLTFRVLALLIVGRPMQQNILVSIQGEDTTELSTANINPLTSV